MNALNIPEIVSNVFSFLDPKELAKVAMVSKIWRLEARLRLYNNRRHIIYNILKPHLNDIRIHRLLPPRLSILQLQVACVRVLHFVHAFGLDFKVEHLAIRNSLRARHRNMKKASRKLDKICLRLHQKAMETLGRQCTWQEIVTARKEYAEAIRKFNKAEDARYELYRDLVNFRYFLVRFTSIHDESIDDVCDAVDSLRGVEYERMWRNDGTGILDYWGDEDPDA
jgi:hypothetical protein